jgi:hypothetical protein
VELDAQSPHNYRRGGLTLSSIYKVHHVHTIAKVTTLRPAANAYSLSRFCQDRPTPTLIRASGAKEREFAVQHVADRWHSPLGIPKVAP